MERTVNEEVGRSRRSFRFEAIWIRKNECEDIIKRMWERNDETNPSMGMIFKGEQCRLEFLQWSTNCNPNKLIQKTQRRVMELRNGVQTVEERAELAELTVELEKLYLD